MPLQREWLDANKDFFVRDLVRDYCKAYNIIEEQLSRFSNTGTLSYAVLNELLGEAAHQGLFWQLKDKAHHVLRAEESDYCAQALDWAIGYAFHECVKLREDAFQHQHYRSRLVHLCASAGEKAREGTKKESGEEAGEEIRMLEKLNPLLLQTHESAARELARILYTLTQCRVFFIHYLKRCGAQPHLARFFTEHEQLVKQGFGELYPALLEALYGRQPQHMLLLAAQSCLRGGRPQQALDILRSTDPPLELAQDFAQNRGLATLALAQLVSGGPPVPAGKKAGL